MGNLLAQAQPYIPELLPRHPVPVDVNNAEGLENYPLFTMKKLEQAILTMKSNKVLGPDGIRAEVFKPVFCQRLRGALNVCLKEGIFRYRWKGAKLALISKRKGGPKLPSV